MTPPVRLLVVLAHVLALPAAAQHGFALAPPTGAGPASITVTGVGTAEAEADVAVVHLSLDTEGATVEEAVALQETEIARVTAALRAAGVAADAIDVDRLSLGGDMDGDFIEPGFRGQSDDKIVVSRAITARVTDLPTVVGLVSTLASDSGDDALAVQRRSVTVTYEVADTDTLRDEALRAAVRDARRRADLIAAASGLRVGAALSVTEGGVTAALVGGGAAAMPTGLLARMMGGGGGSTQAERASVVVVYRVDE